MKRARPALAAEGAGNALTETMRHTRTSRSREAIVRDCDRESAMARLDR
jgi:hypothetical protein